MIGLTIVLLIASVVMLVIPMANSLTGAVIAVNQDIDRTSFCENAIDDLVRLNKIKTDIPEVEENYDFTLRLNTAEAQVKTCY